MQKDRYLQRLKHIHLKPLHKARYIKGTCMISFESIQKIKKIAYFDGMQ